MRNLHVSLWKHRGKDTLKKQPEVAIVMPGKESSPETESCWTLTLEFQPPGTVRRYTSVLPAIQPVVLSYGHLELTKKHSLAIVVLSELDHPKDYAWWTLWLAQPLLCSLLSWRR